MPRPPATPTTPVLVLVGALLLGTLAGCSRGGDPAGAPGNPPAGIRIEVRLGLVRDQAGLEAAALAANDPADPSYGRFLDRPTIAARFGAPADRQDAVLATLREQGVDATVDPTGGVVRASMRLDQAGTLFGVTFEQGQRADGATFVQPTGAPQVPDALRGQVSEVVGLTRTVVVPAAGAGSMPPGTDPPALSSPPQPDAARCAASTATATALQQRYGITSIGATPAGAQPGAGTTVAVPAIDVLRPEPLATWAACLPERPTPRVETSGPGYPVEELDSEVELDLATLLAVAPGVERIDVLGFDPIGWVGDPYLDALSTGGELVDVISSSETFCEPALAASDVELAEWTLAALAASGVTTVVAAGDTGSTGCYPQRSDLAVEYPASSPFVTAVGGTQIEGPTGDRTSPEVVWFDASARQAGGGGDSAVSDRPPWQPGDGPHRRVPDVAYVAEPASWPEIPVCQADGTCQWQRIGGTSAATPLFAGGVLRLKQQLVAQGRVPPGLLNALLRDVATAPGGAGAIDVVDGQNGVVTDGCCAATQGFDPASGWGAVALDRLTVAAAGAAPAADAAR